MLFRFAIRHPVLVILAATVITLGIAPGVVKLEIRTDGHALVPPYASEITLDKAIRDEFGIEDPIVVLIRSNHAMGIFNPSTLSLVQDLTTEFQKFDTVTEGNVTSLAVEKSDRVRPGTLIFRRFFEPLPRTVTELNQLRDDLRAIELYSGVLVSYDEHATAILVGVPPNVSRTQFYQRIVDHIAAKGDRPERIDVIGAPVAEALLGTHLLEDLGVPSFVLGHRLDQAAPPPWSVPKNLDDLRLLIGKRIGLVPIALVVMSLVFLVSFRNVFAPLIPLTEVGACLAVVFGLMGWFGVPVYLTIAVLPVILTATGVADEIHIFACYREILRADIEKSQVAAIREAMEEMWVPVVKTSITTAIGFLSFALSPIRPVQAFGVFTATGVLFCMFWSLTVVPALLALVPARWLVRRPKARPRKGFIAACMPLLGRATIALRWGLVPLTLVLLVVTPVGASKINVQDSWIDGFAPRSQFHQVTDYFNENFLGVHTLLVSVDAGQSPALTGRFGRDAVDHRGLRISAKGIDNPDDLVGQSIYLRRDGLPGGITVKLAVPQPVYTWSSRIEDVTRQGDNLFLSTSRRNGSPAHALKLRANEYGRYRIRPEWFMKPEYAHIVQDLEKFIAGHKEDAVGGVLGPADYLSTTEFMIRGRKAGSRQIPDSVDRMEWVWGQYRNVRGEHRWKQAVTEDYSKALVSVYLKDANFRDTKRLMESIRSYEREHLRPKGIHLEFAGDVAVSQTLIDAIVTTQVISLIGSLIGIFLVTAVLSRSVLWGLLCVMPCTLAVLANFAFMGWTKMPLGVATSMFSGMTLGIGVDYAIHLIERYRRASRSGMTIDDALIDALKSAGPAIIIDALGVALGFGVMILSQVPANARLGILVVLSIAWCLAATLLVLPALIRVLHMRAIAAPQVSDP